MRSFAQHVRLTEASAEKSMQFMDPFLAKVTADDWDAFRFLHEDHGNRYVSETDLDDTHWVTYGDREEYKQLDRDHQIRLYTGTFNLIQNEKDPTRGDYVVWIVRNYANNGIRLIEDFDRASHALAVFHKAKTSGWFRRRENAEYAKYADINSFKSLSILETFLRERNLADASVSSDAFEKHLKGGGITLIWGDKDNYVIRLNSLEASVDLYRGPTSWCTARPGNSYFESYSEDGPLFVFKDDTIYLQIHLPSGQTLDQNDESISREVFSWFSVNHAPKLLAHFKSNPNDIFLKLNDTDTVLIRQAAERWLEDVSEETFEDILLEPGSVLGWRMVQEPYTEIDQDDAEDYIDDIPPDLLYAWLVFDESGYRLMKFMDIIDAEIMVAAFEFLHYDRKTLTQRTWPYGNTEWVELVAKYREARRLDPE